MSTRPSSSASSRRGPPPAQPRISSLEQLVYSLVPALAPSRNSSARPDDPAEKDRREKVSELIEWCEEIMSSRLPSSTPLSAGTLPDTVKRLLSQASGRDAKESSSENALRFSGIWNKLEKGRLLSSPIPHLQFLLALSILNPNNIPRPSSYAQPSSSSAAAGARSMPPPPPPATFASTKPGSSRLPLTEMGANTSLPAMMEFSAKGKSKADVIKQWRASKSQPPFPPHLLLRDTLYLLQGIDGRFVRFAISPPKEQNPYLTEKGREGAGTGFPLGKDGGVVQPDGDGGEGEEVVGIEIVADEAKDGYISQPTRTLLMQLSEMGMLYRRVTDFINARQAAEGKGGMTEQSLCHFLHHELSEYHRLLAVLESQMNLSAPAEEDKPAEGGGLTLMRLGLWTEEIKIKLRQMSAVVDEAKAVHGGALVSKIHLHTSHGDPLIRNFTSQVLEEVSKPFFSTLQRWIFSGELHDPFHEFFVQLNPDAAILPRHDTGDEDLGGGDVGGEGMEEAYKVWEKKYVFVKGMVPGFVSEDFAKKIFSTGRSLNFIRYSCHDSDWIETQAKLANAGRALKYSDLAGLERSIDDAYSIASQRLLEIFFDKFRLLDHLRALKAYLMLGAGDFTELLMEALAPRLSKPAISLYRHHLTSDLESAIRGSNAQFDSPDILRRLDARILEYSHGETGWDCFALQYKVEAPLNAVLDARAMGDYDRLFNHLWMLKRVEVALTQGWMRVTSGSRVYERLSGLNNDWHHCRIVQAEMVHFLRQIQAFCQLEVIECSWAELMEFTEKREGDLDALIAAHRRYLSRVVRKVLLLGSKREKEEVLLDLVREALDYILQFRDATDDLNAWSLAEATRLDRTRDASRGLYTPSTAQSDDPSRSQEQLQSVRTRIRSVANAFQDRMVSVAHVAGTHSDLDVRFLAIRLAFNGHYSMRKKEKVGSRGTRG